MYKSYILFFPLSFAVSAYFNYYLHFCCSCRTMFDSRRIQSILLLQCVIFDRTAESYDLPVPLPLHIFLDFCKYISCCHLEFAFLLLTGQRSEQVSSTYLLTKKDVLLYTYWYLQFYCCYSKTNIIFCFDLTSKKHRVRGYNQSSTLKYELHSDNLLVNIVYILTDLSSHSRPSCF